MTEPSALLLLHPRDNVLVVVRPVGAGEPVLIDGTLVSAAEAIEVGHKVARLDLMAGSKIVKYGAPIGSLKQAVKCGAHVHLHNMKSDYIPSHTRKASGDERL